MGLLGEIVFTCKLVMVECSEAFVEAEEEVAEDEEKEEEGKEEEEACSYRSRPFLHHEKFPPWKKKETPNVIIRCKGKAEGHNFVEIKNKKIPLFPFLFFPLS